MRVSLIISQAEWRGNQADEARKTRDSLREARLVHAKAFAQDIGDIGDHHKGLRVQMMDDLPQLVDLMAGDDDEEDVPLLLGVEARSFERRSAAIELSHDPVADLLGPVGDDEGALGVASEPSWITSMALLVTKTERKA